jgi:vacuolar-type H+-ATPase subunit H
MESMLEYFDILEDVLDAGKIKAFSSKISIDRETIFDIIGEMRLNLPNEIRQAKKIIEDHDRIIEDAKNKANMIIQDAQQTANDLTSEHEIYKLATVTANNVVDEAKQNAREIRIGTMNYADGILSKSEESLRKTLEQLASDFKGIEENISTTINVLYGNRQEIRGTKE